MQQAGNENTQAYQVEVVISILLQILVTKLQGNVKQPEERINNQILGVKGLTILTCQVYTCLVLCNCCHHHKRLQGDYSKHYWHELLYRISHTTDTDLMDLLPGYYGPGLQHEQKSYQIVSCAQKIDNENEIPAAR